MKVHELLNESAGDELIRKIEAKAAEFKKAGVEQVQLVTRKKDGGPAGRFKFDPTKAIGDDGKFISNMDRHLNFAVHELEGVSFTLEPT